MNSALEARRVACFDCIISTVLIEIRRAKPHDAGAVADAHDEAWRTAYQGIIPSTELDRLINRRGPVWWDSAIRKGSRIALLQFGDKVAGYANYGATARAACITTARSTNSICGLNFRDWDSAGDFSLPHAAIWRKAGSNR